MPVILHTMATHILNNPAKYKGVTTKRKNKRGTYARYVVGAPKNVNGYWATRANQNPKNGRPYPGGILTDMDRVMIRGGFDYTNEHHGSPVLRIGAYAKEAPCPCCGATTPGKNMRLTDAGRARIQELRGR